MEVGVGLSGKMEGPTPCSLLLPPVARVLLEVEPRTRRCSLPNESSGGKAWITLCFNRCVSQSRLPEVVRLSCQGG
jgi:hypothetical protein